MRLPPEQAERFFRIWGHLLFFVNQRKQLVSEFKEPEQITSLKINHVLKLRDALWADDALREAFIAENPARLDEPDLELVKSWAHRHAGQFLVLRQLKRHAIVYDEKARKMFAVIGLYSAIDEVVPFIPCIVQMVLLPFEGQIVYDGLTQPYNISIGPGIRADLNAVYKDYRERGALVTSLTPGPEPPHEQTEEKAHEVNARVLAALQQFLYASGLGPRVVDRDLEAVRAFADDYLALLPEPRSLRDFGEAELLAYLAQPQLADASRAKQRKDVVLGLKRLLKFLGETERMDWHEAQDLRRLLAK
jgi:hypothetical protein